MATRRQNEARRMLGRPTEGLRLGFLSEVASELRKVVWPTREEATRLTVMVIVVAVTVGVALGLIDIGFASLVRGVLIG